jgi:hypothetical protein
MPRYVRDKDKVKHISQPLRLRVSGRQALCQAIKLKRPKGSAPYLLFSLQLTAYSAYLLPAYLRATGPRPTFCL